MTDFDMNQVELRARKLRAEAMASGWSSFKVAISTAFAGLIFPTNLGSRKIA